MTRALLLLLVCFTAFFLLSVEASSNEYQVLDQFLSEYSHLPSSLKHKLAKQILKKTKFKQFDEESDFFDFFFGKKEDVTPKTPFILVPGFLGSKLQVKLDKDNDLPSYCTKHFPVGEYHSLWLSHKFLNKPFRHDEYEDCFYHLFYLVYNGTSDTFSNRRGVDVRVVGRHGKSDNAGIDGVDYFFKFAGQGIMPYYGDMIERLEEDLNYTPGKNIKGFPFDWRIPTPYYEKQTTVVQDMKQLVEATYRENDNTPVIIVGHSMGTLLCMSFLRHMEPSWLKHYVKAYFSFSSPFEGLIRNIGDLYHGQTIIPENFVTDMLGDIFDRLRMKELAHNVHAVAMFASRSNSSHTMVSFKHEKKHFAANEVEQLLRFTNFETSLLMYQKGTEFFKRIQAPLPDGLKLVCFYSDKVKTEKGFKYDTVKNLNVKPEIVYGDGDGAVHIESLEYCKKWQKDHGVVVKVYHDVAHSKIVNDDKVLDDVIEYVKKH